MGQDIVVVNVGKDKIPSSLHKSLLCASSEFFEKAFTGQFKEAKEKAMHFEDVNIHVFECFVEWLYYGTITVVGKKDMQLDLLVDVYIFADRVLCAGLKNSVMDHLQDVMYIKDAHSGLQPYIFLSASHVQKIFDNTVNGKSEIRMYCAAIASHAIFIGQIQVEVEGYFAVKGFLSVFSEFQRKLKYNFLDWDSRDWHLPVPSDDPRMRGTRGSRDFVGDDIEVGYCICFFHSHGSEECVSNKNYARLAGDEESGDDHEW